MKYLSGLFLILLILAGCQTKVTENTNVETAVIDGYIILQNANVDTVNIDMDVILNDDNTYHKPVTPQANGYFKAEQLKPGNYTLKVSFDIMNYEDEEIAVALFIDKTTSFGEINFSRIEPTASLNGYVTFDEKAVPQTNIDFYYKIDDDYQLAKSTVSDTMGYYDFSTLFPKDGKLTYSAENYDVITKYIALVANQAVIMDTILFENIPLIQNQTIAINDTIDSGWNSIYENTHVSDWSASNDFENLYLAYDDDSLYIAVDGGFDPGGNCVNIYIDTDFGDGTGINDFSQIQGDGIGDHLRKNVETPDNFGANIAFSEWALSSNINVVSLEDPSAVDQYVLTSNISINSSVIEIAIPLSEIYPQGVDIAGKKIAVVALIGGGDESQLANDTIPQQDDASHFESVVIAKFPN